MWDNSFCHKKKSLSSNAKLQEEKNNTVGVVRLEEGKD